MFCLKLFQLANTLSFSNFIRPQLFILFIVKLQIQSMKVEKAINGSLSMD